MTAFKGRSSYALTALTAGLVLSLAAPAVRAQAPASLKEEFLDGAPIAGCGAGASAGDSGLAAALAAVQAGRRLSETEALFLARIGEASRRLGLSVEETAAVKILYGGRARARPLSGGPAGGGPSRMPPGRARALRARADDTAAALGTGTEPGALAAETNARVSLSGPAASGAAVRGPDAVRLDALSPPPPQTEATRLLVNNPDPLQSCRWLFFCKNANGVRYAPMGALGRYGLFLRKGSEPAVSPVDVRQGSLGDCYYLASLGAIAQSHPDVLRRMIRRNPDGTFSATFYRRRLPWEFWKLDFEPIEVRVDDEFPASLEKKFDGNIFQWPAYAQSGRYGGVKEELWPMIAEKAFALYHGGYDAIDLGWPDRALEEITGRPSRVYAASSVSTAALARWKKEKRAVLVGTKTEKDSREDSLYKAGRLVPSHVYWVKFVDEGNGAVTLVNPWGSAMLVVLDSDQFGKSLEAVYVNDVIGP